MKKTILITGALGYLGGRIALRLNSEKNFSVRLSARHRPNNYPKWCKGLRIVEFDFEQSKCPENLCKDVDVVIHLAALNALDSLNEPERAKKINVDGTKRLISAAIREGVKRFVYISTAHVYGTPLIGCISEKKKPTPSTPYAETHFLAEQIVLNEERIDGVILRLSNLNFLSVQ